MPSPPRPPPSRGGAPARDKDDRRDKQDKQLMNDFRATIVDETRTFAELYAPCRSRTHATAFPSDALALTGSTARGISQ